MALDGLGVWITPGQRVGIADASSGWRWGPAPLRRRARYLRTGDIDELPPEDRRSLVVARRITHTALTALSSAGIAWALDDGRYHVGDRESTGPLPGPLPEPRKADLRAAAALLLAERPDRSQRRLAALLDVSQPRVNRLLRQLARSGADPDRREDLIAVWLRSRHDPGGEFQHWVSDAPAWDQVAQAYDVLDSAGHTPVVGGEPAADQFTAWATPITAVIHAKGLRPLGAPFVPATRDEATLTVEATRDPLAHVLAVERRGPVGDRRIAHPAIVVRDLEPLASGDDRVAEVVDRLRSWTRGGAEHASR